MRTTLLALACSLAVGLTACESTASNSGFADQIRGHTWIAEAIDSEDVLDGTRVTMTVDGDKVSGKAGCNSYGGPVEISGDRVKFGALFSTRMACMREGVMEQEQRFLSTLRRVTHGEIRSDGILLLKGRAGVIEFNAE
ncbi:MAG: META domain-containing protein [Alphaproteobacteria bacterium]|nr:META domain-containing protein [Alphaproteobacteria bacterium]